MLMFLLVFWVVLIIWMLFCSFRETMRMNFKACHKRKIAKIDNEFGKGTWEEFIKNDLKETQQTIKKVLSKKKITSDEYYKLTELVDEMERYIKNNIKYSPITELDDELELLRKINAQKSSNK